MSGCRAKTLAGPALSGSDLKNGMSVSLEAIKLLWCSAGRRCWPRRGRDSRQRLHDAAVLDAAERHFCSDTSSVADPLSTNKQSDARVRHWAFPADRFEVE